MRVGIHPPHTDLQKREPKAHHRPAPEAIWPPAKRQVWERPCHRTLTGVIARVITRGVPLQAHEIVERVRDDYGAAKERSIYRYLKVLVMRGHVKKVDVGLSFSVYLRPGSRLLNDLEALREVVTSRVDWWTPMAKPRLRKPPPQIIEWAKLPETIQSRARRVHETERSLAIALVLVAEGV